MKPLISRIYLVLLSAFIACLSANASTVKSGFSERTIDNKGTANSVRVRCFMGEREFKLSIATVLQSSLSSRKNNKRDIALTTGHGLVDNNGQLLSDCYVYDPTGRRIEVKAIKMAPNFKEASATDWAVLVFNRIKSPNLIRYSVDPTLSLATFEKLAHERVDVKFSKARGILENRQECHLFPRRNANLAYRQFEGILPHSCRAIGGQSGSPVSVAGVESDVVIGIHLGNSFSLPIENVIENAGWIGFMRIIDSAFLNDLDAIVATIERDF